jgi:hypothetical protein
LSKNLSESGAAPGTSANSPWVGAQVSYRFGDGGNAGDNLLLSGRVLRDITLDEANKIHLPVMANVSSLASAVNKEDSKKDAVEAQADKMLLSSEGVNAGVYPYYSFVDKTKLLLTVHGVAAWRLNALREFGIAEDVADADLVYLHQGRFALGVDALIGDRSNGTAAILLSAALVQHAYSNATYEKAFGEKSSGFTAVELVGILPIMDNTGIIFESVLGGSSRRAFRAGIVVAGK